MRRIALGLLAGSLIMGLIAAPVSARSGPTIVETAIAVNADSGEFSTLIAAVVAADLVDALNGKRQFTVFAPTDAAFAKLGLNAGNVGSLPKATLQNILKYHVTPGSRDSSSVVGSDRIRMLNGGFIKPSVTASGAFVNDSKIIAVDISTSNGIIHVIDTVLLP
ncbi:MAG: fasciclin domain-containing protein [Chloroflexota bacterium]